jgi:(p)ppGpp synthase/HD superfamily hydrolase
MKIVVQKGQTVREAYLDTRNKIAAAREAQLAEQKLLADTYMEIVASIMTQQGLDEIEIDLESVPKKPFSVWRKVVDGRLVVRLTWGDQAPAEWRM